MAHRSNPAQRDGSSNPWISGSSPRELLYQCGPATKELTSPPLAPMNSPPIPTGLLLNSGFSVTTWKREVSSSSIFPLGTGHTNTVVTAAMGRSPDLEVGHPACEKAHGLYDLPPSYAHPLTAGMEHGPLAYLSMTPPAYSINSSCIMWLYSAKLNRAPNSSAVSTGNLNINTVNSRLLIKLSFVKEVEQ